MAKLSRHYHQTPTSPSFDSRGVVCNVMAMMIGTRRTTASVFVPALVSATLAASLTLVLVTGVHASEPGDGRDATASDLVARAGVYSLSDGGASWTHRGLEDSHHVARIVVHPDDSDVVFVAAMGHLFLHNDQRGVLRTADGGESWEHVLDLGPEAPVIDLVIDLVIDPGNPGRLFAASHDNKRLPWHLDLGGQPGLNRAVWRTREADVDPPAEAGDEETEPNTPTPVRHGEVIVELVSDDEHVLPTRRSRLLPMPARPVQP